MNIDKIKNGNKHLEVLKMISTNMNKLNKSKSESKHKDLNNIKFLNYKILIQEKDNDILKLKNEIDYYKDCINIKQRKRNFEGFNNKKKKKLNIFKINNVLRLKNYKTIEHEDNSHDIFKHKFDSMQVKKIKLIQKKSKNFSEQNNLFKNNNEFSEKKSYSNSLSENKSKSNLINFSVNSVNISNNNENILKLKMENLQNRMKNLMNNIFDILQKNKNNK